MTRLELVFDHQVFIAAEGASVGVNVRVLGVEIFVVAVDEGEGVGTQCDQRAHIVEDGGGVGLLLGRANLLIVGIDGKPRMAATGEASLGRTIPLHGGTGVVAGDLTGDGRVHLAVVNGASRSLSVLKPLVAVAAPTVPGASPTAPVPGGAQNPLPTGRGASGNGVTTTGTAPSNNPLPAGR